MSVKYQLVIQPTQGRTMPMAFVGMRTAIPP